jgi:hypothetical protein
VVAKIFPFIAAVLSRSEGDDWPVRPKSNNTSHHSTPSVYSAARSGAGLADTDRVSQAANGLVVTR